MADTYRIRRGNEFYRNGTKDNPTVWTTDRGLAATWDSEDGAKKVLAHWDKNLTVIGGYAVGLRKSVPVYNQHGKMTGYAVVDNNAAPVVA